MTALPIGVSIRSIRSEPGWWLESARRLEAAGYQGVWSWDHYMNPEDPMTPVVEGWTILSMAAALTSRITIGSYVINVMNHHPAVLARMASTLQIASGGRLVLGMGIGGNPVEHAAYGMEFPEPKERVARLVEAVAVIRALWTGGPVTRDSVHYPLSEAVALPIPQPPPPIIIGGQTPAGARLAARIGDGWTLDDHALERLFPIYLQELETVGRRRVDQRIYVGCEGPGWLADFDLAETAWVREPRAEWQRWREAGADGAVLLARTTADVDALVGAVERW